MKVSQLFKACQENKYIIIRDYSGRIMGINCAIHKMERFKFKGIETDCANSNYQSFYPCSFQEYITLKAPFYTPYTVTFGNQEFSF